MRIHLVCGLALLISGFIDPFPAHAAPRVEGDAEALRLLQAAQVTNRSLYRRGQMTAEVRDKVSNTSASAHVIWENERTFWDFHYQCPAGKSRQMLIRKGQQIQSPKTYFYYNPSVRLAVKMTDSKGGYEDLLKLRPDQVWFRMEGPFGGPEWAMILDPLRAHKIVSHYVVSHLPDDRVVVERYQHNGDVLKIVVSLAQGGNVITYDQIPGPEAQSRVPESGIFWAHGVYEWAQDMEGNWYLTRHAFARSSTGDPKQLHFDYELLIKDFNPNPMIPKDRFEFSSFRLPVGTSVQEKNAQGRTKRTYRVGGKDLLGEDSFDFLIESLKNRGFARPERAIHN